MPLEISTVGGVNIGKSRYAAQIQVAPINGSASALATTASILKSLTKYSPSQPRNHNEWTHLAHLALADPTPFSAEPIDAIIGADLYSEMLFDKVIKGAPGQPAAQATIFGWILSGPISDPSPPGHVISVRHCAKEVPRKPPLTPEEQQCEDHFANTHSRGPDGRYIVRLPFKRGPPIEIGNSRATAEWLLRALHRRLSVRPELKIEYSQFLCDYESLNHMHRVTEANDSSQTVYVPHHAVIRDGSATTHLRVVFNASCQTSNATSLNDHLLAGPKLQADLSAVILRWRLFRYIYAADITKMYRQIQIDPRDINYQRILWSPEPNNPVLTFRLSTVTYGTACAPFLALRVIRQLVADEGAAFPLAASVLSENVYVDDVLFGADSVPRLKQIRTQVCSLLRQGKFELRKWSSNSAELLDDISVEDHGIACDKTLQSDESLKILGIIWSPSTDVFQFKVSFDSVQSTTKRSILSTISKLFDPLGWSTPITITAKMFIQTLWQSKLDWDDVLPPDFLIQWERIQFSLSELHGLSLPRWVQHEAQTEQCELHGFADASAQAYAAVVYLRLVSKSGVVTTQLLIGKSKVAPLTPLNYASISTNINDNEVTTEDLQKNVIVEENLSGDNPCYYKDSDNNDDAVFDDIIPSDGGYSDDEYEDNLNHDNNLIMFYEAGLTVSDALQMIVGYCLWFTVTIERKGTLITLIKRLARPKFAQCKFYEAGLTVSDALQMIVGYCLWFTVTIERKGALIAFIK
ncbi:uncharacterized protein LOC113005795 [Solenopsis invicta]|uniref:uncharacterized protein LOC113005795 n=1 Tax=Solenopsis invicta TaxID=13686 RepID=UPI00193D43BA|nr:uncharacterized protein LOC113005795 [Solenopsis invicta]